MRDLFLFFPLDIDLIVRAMRLDHHGFHHIVAPLLFLDQSTRIAEIAAALPFVDVFLVGYQFVFTILTFLLMVRVVKMCEDLIDSRTVLY